MLKKKLIFLLTVVSLLLVLSVSVVAAQSSGPVVTIKATDPTAKEPADNGEFTVYRSTSGTSTAALTVYYSVTGTATSGLDYVSLSGSVVIPAGAISAPIPVKVRDDTARELPETVIVKLIQYCPGPLPCTYSIGTSGTATVTIYDND